MQERCCYSGAPDPNGGILVGGLITSECDPRPHSPPSPLAELKHRSVKEPPRLGHWHGGKKKQRDQTLDNAALVHEIWPNIQQAHERGQGSKCNARLSQAARGRAWEQADARARKTLTRNKPTLPRKKGRELWIQHLKLRQTVDATKEPQNTTDRARGVRPRCDRRGCFYVAMAGAHRNQRACRHSHQTQL